nr:alkaline phosphatase D family protein [Acidimicrobiia bacterium]
DNNWADEVPQDPEAQPPAAFLARREAALRAYYEHMPLRAASLPRGIDMQLYRRVGWGDLAAFHVLDTRQYRSDQVGTPEEAARADRSILGAEQEGWLFDGLAHSSGRWNVLAQQVFLSENDRRPGPEDAFDFDNWDGYRASRDRLLGFLGSRRPSNPIVLTGDRHYNWVADLMANVADPASPVLGTEFVGTSISTGGDEIPGLADALFDPVVPESPHWRYFDAARGYLRCELDRRSWQTDLRVVSAVSTPDATVSTRASFVVEDGRAGVTQTAGPALV